MKKHHVLLISLWILVAVVLCACSEKPIDVPLNSCVVVSDVDNADLLVETFAEKGITLSLSSSANENGSVIYFGAEAGNALFTDKKTGESTLGEYTIYDYFVRADDSAIAVIAGSTDAYAEAVEYLVGCYNAETGTLVIPSEGYHGEWNPPLRGLTIGGNSIEEYTILTDSSLTWDITEMGNTLSTALDTLTGHTIPVEKSDRSTAEKIIYLALPSHSRDLPFTADEAYCGVHDGNLYIYGTSPVELEKLFNIVMNTSFTADAKKEVADSLPENPVLKYEEYLIHVSPSDTSFVDAMAEAKTAMKQAADSEKEMSVIIELADGIYSLSEQLTFDATDLNQGYTKLTIRAAEGANPIIDGMTYLDSSKFQKVDGESYYVYQFDALEDGTYPLFYNFYDQGQLIPIAESEINKLVFGLSNPNERLHVNNLKGIYLPLSTIEALGVAEFPTHLTLYVEWESFVIPIAGVDYEDTRKKDDETYVRVQLDKEQWELLLSKMNGGLMNIEGRRYFFTNNPNLLTPNSWVYNHNTGTLYYYPENDTLTTLSYSNIETLLFVNGMDRITFDGITFTGTGYGAQIKNGYLAGQANSVIGLGSILTHAALLLEDCSNVTVQNCSFLELGTNALQTYGNVVGIDIKDNLFNDISMSAISIGYHTTAWDTNNMNYNIHIENNVIHDIGMECPTATAVYISHADNLKLLHNTISKTAYTAISIGWGWVAVPYEFGETINIRNADIAFNRILDFMQVLDDGGAIYVLGGNVKNEYTEYFNFIHDNYAEKERSSNKTISGFYLDGGASNWEVYHNVSLGARKPFTSQHIAEFQDTHNNYFHDNFADYEIEDGTESKKRNVKIENTSIAIKGKAAVMERFPEAGVIYETTGANWSIEE